MLLNAVVLLACVSIPTVVSTVSECNISPANWCDSLDCARRCGVYDECYKNVWSRGVRQGDALPVNVTLYYESMCPGCRQFITTQLYPAFNKIPTIINITLVPYGNAHEKQTPSGKWDFECQHGPQECVGNLIEACAINILKNISTYFPFINCIESSEDIPSKAAEKCATETGIQKYYSSIETCANGAMGNKLMHQYAVKTGNLKPPHQYTPWIVVNDKHTSEEQEEAQSHLIKYVCKLYKGAKPSGCNQKQALDICMK